MDVDDLLAQLDDTLEGRSVVNSANSILSRLAEAPKELAQATAFQHVIINDDFAMAKVKLIGLLDASLQLKIKATSGSAY